jgi:coenzyme F420 hydrogenase subunit beta
METYLNFIVIQTEPIGAIIMKMITEKIADSMSHPLEDASHNSHQQDREETPSCQSKEISGIANRDPIEPLLLPIHELEKSVWLKDVCSSCMGCISVCPAGTLAYDHERNRPHQITSCVDCKACLDVCPRIPANNQNISSQILGPCISIKNAKSKIDSIRSQNGGVATALLTAALDEELVDCALVMGQDPWSQRSYPRVVYDAKELKKCAGSKYTSNAILEPLKDLIKCTKNIALVGTPCSVHAMGLMRRSSNEFAERVAQKVRFVIGLFCFEAYDESVIPDISKIIGEPAWRFDGMNIGDGKMTIKLRDGGFRTIPLQHLAEDVKTGCKACADFTAKLSDISIGRMGSASGMSTVIVRTSEGMGLFDIAEDMGLLEVTDGVNVEAIERASRLKLTKNGIILSDIFGGRHQYVRSKSER